MPTILINVTSYLQFCSTELLGCYVIEIAESKLTIQSAVLMTKFNNILSFSKKWQIVDYIFILMFMI